MKPRLVFTTDLNGTTTPENTFAALMADEEKKAAMRALMGEYTTGRKRFADVLPEMERLAAGVTRERALSYAGAMPYFSGVEETLVGLLGSSRVDALAAYSTTGFAGLVALISVRRHQGRLRAAASPVLRDLLTEEERRLLLRPIRAEGDKAKVLDDLCREHRPSPGLVFHVGDTLGDLPGIMHAAGLGGLGIAFCPNRELREAMENMAPALRENLRVVEPGPAGPDYGRVGELVAERVRSACGQALGW
ncbi:MAG: hypothetical protein AB1921_16510 [Thermodesulfobacteriota bacterium]